MHNDSPNLAEKYFLYLKVSTFIIAFAYAFVLFCFWIIPYVSIAFNTAQAFASIGVVFYSATALLVTSLVVSFWFLCIAFNIKRNGSDNLLNKVRYITTGISLSLLLDFPLFVIFLLGLKTMEPDNPIISFFPILFAILISIKIILYFVVKNYESTEVDS